jgi:hypothetical protein
MRKVSDGHGNAHRLSARQQDVLDAVVDPPAPRWLRLAGTRRNRRSRSVLEVETIKGILN